MPPSSAFRTPSPSACCEATRETVLSVGTPVAEHLWTYGSPHDPSAELLPSQGVGKMLRLLRGTFAYTVVDDWRITLLGVLVTFALLVQFASFLADVEKGPRVLEKILWRRLGHLPWDDAHHGAAYWLDGGTMRSQVLAKK